MKQIRWLAFDLDRTIIGPSRLLLPRTEAVLHRAMDDGYKVILATGRPPRSTRPFVEQLKRELPIVCYNGGYAEAPDGEKLCDCRMDAATAIRVLDAMRAGNPGAILMECNDRFHYDEYSAFAEKHHARWPQMDVSTGKLDYVSRSGANKFLGIGNAETIARTTEKLYQYVPDQGIIRPTLYPEHELSFIEVMPAGVTKKTGLDAVLGRFGWSWHAGITFGDAVNDIEMIQASKYSVAVTDSAPEVLDIATFQCSSAREEGVAVWLEQWLDERAEERRKEKEIAQSKTA